MAYKWQVHSRAACYHPPLAMIDAITVATVVSVYAAERCQWDNATYSGSNGVVRGPRDPA